MRHAKALPTLWHALTASAEALGAGHQHADLHEAAARLAQGAAAAQRERGSEHPEDTGAAAGAAAEAASGEASLGASRGRVLSAGASLTSASDVGDAELRRRLFEARRKAVQGSWKAAAEGKETAEEEEPGGGGASAQGGA